MIVVAVVIVGGAIAAYFYSTRDDTGKTAAKPAATVPAAAAAPKAPDPAPETVVLAGPKLSVPELLKNGSAAVADGRLIEPIGNNAIESYLGVLEVDPNNRSARDALIEIFPLATTEVERQINSDHVDEAARSIALLGKADRDNYALTILRGKLDTKRKQIEKDQEKAQAAKDARNAPAPTAATAAITAPPPAPSTPAPVPVATPAPAPAAPPATTAAAPPAPAATAPAAAASPPATAAGETRAATLTQRVNPNYPPEAARKHQEGWVEVSFTVGTDGKVKDAFVIAANPNRVFDNAALQAVANWTFQPRLEGGKPVEQHIKSRIEFKL